MQKIAINIQEPYKTFVINGQKTVEGRLNKGKFASIQKGDILVLAPDDLEFKVIAKSIYKSFRGMVEVEGVENVIPDKTNINEAVGIYYKFYTKEQEEKFGVVAIKIKRVD